MAIDPARTAAYTDLQSLQGLRREARTQDSQSVREAARQFESLFTRMLLSSMRQASPGDSLFDSNESGFYRDMFDDQLAVEMSHGRGLGLAEMLVEQLVRSGSGRETAAGGLRMPNDEQNARGIPGPPPTASGVSDAVDQPGRLEFLERMRPYAEAAGRELGVSPRTLLAHAALETGWGRSMPAEPGGGQSFNLFGIKAGGRWVGDSVQSLTTEFDGGKPRVSIEHFRAYGSAEESFSDYVGLLSNNQRYAPVLGSGDDAAAFGNALQRAGYATDPRYGEKLAAVAASVSATLDSFKPGKSLPIPSSNATG